MCFIKLPSIQEDDIPDIDNSTTQPNMVQVSVNSDDDNEITRSDTVIVHASPDAQKEGQSGAAEEGADRVPPSTGDLWDDQWHEAERIEKQRYYGNKRQYLVRWQDGSPPSWVRHDAVTPYLLQQFHINRNLQGRLRKKYRRST